MIPEIRLKGAPNFRDLGGHSTADGRRVRRGRIFRSEGLNDLASEDYAILQSLGIRLICDLRSDLERSHKPTIWPLPLQPMTVVMDVNADMRSGDSKLSSLLRDDPSEHGVLALMMGIYRSMPNALMKHLGKFFSLAAQDEQLPLILHCTAGKDRTGVLSAILLLALGVPRDSVFVDYLKTNMYQDPNEVARKVCGLLEGLLGAPPTHKMLHIMLTVQAIYLEAAVESIESSYGSLQGYLQSAGVSSELLAEFRSRLLE